jgi:hypothetical protein
MSNFYIYKFGRANDVDAACDVYDVSSGNYEFPTVATSTQVVGIANDIPSSDGVHSVRIEGLLADGSEVSEVATLNGATPVVLTNSFYRVNRAYILATGATGINSGQINVTHSGSATLARISPLEGQTLQAIYTMPAGVSGAIAAWHVDAAREASQVTVAASVRLQTRENGQGWRTKDSGIAGNANSLDRRYVGETSAVVVKPMTDIRIRITSLNTNNVSASAGFEIIGFRDVR